MAEHEAQALNLLYFLPAALLALPLHAKNGFLVWRAIFPAVACGLVFAALAALLANRLAMHMLRRLFGIYLLLLGLRELFFRPCSKTRA